MCGTLLNITWALRGRFRAYLPDSFIRDSITEQPWTSEETESDGYSKTSTSWRLDGEQCRIQPELSRMSSDEAEEGP